ncbi:thiopeptide-type bacteriocin biosynthesis protein [Streptomyces sp. ARC12]
MRAAGLEWYEQGDVWHRVITEEHRSAITDVAADSLDARAREIRPLLFADSNALLRPGGPLEPVAEWAAAFRDAGQKLGHAVQDGTLERGLRQVLSYHVIFHWNRRTVHAGTERPGMGSPRGHSPQCGRAVIKYRPRHSTRLSPSMTNWVDDLPCGGDRRLPQARRLNARPCKRTSR